MSEPTRIFVSHSSRDNAFTKQVCQALRGDSSGPQSCAPVVDYEEVHNYDVLVDVDELQAGKPWPKQLHQWMARCHAGLLLLTPNAVKSPWVLKEATILAWRLSLDRHFRFFTVRFDDVSDAELTAGGFDPLMLSDIQALKGRDAAAIAAELRAGLVAAPSTTPYDGLCGALEDLLEHVGDKRLKEIAERMCLDAPQWRPGVDEKQQYVQAIASQLLSEKLGGYEGVHELASELMNTSASKEIVDKILYLVAPHWVDATAAGRLPSVATCRPRRAIAMNGAAVSRFTAEMYVRRAYPLGLSRLQRVLTITESNPGDVVDHVTRELYFYAHRDERPPIGRGPSNTHKKPAGSPRLDKDTVKADAIRHFEKDRFRYFVVLPEDLRPSAADLEELMTRFPKLTFIVSTGHELPDAELEAVVCLKPPVDVAEEERQLADYEAAMQVIAED